MSEPGCFHAKGTPFWGWCRDSLCINQKKVLVSINTKAAGLCIYIISTKLRLLDAPLQFHNRIFMGKDTVFEPSIWLCTILGITPGVNPRSLREVNFSASISSRCTLTPNSIMVYGLGPSAIICKNISFIRWSGGLGGVSVSGKPSAIPPGGVDLPCYTVSLKDLAPQTGET